MKSPNPPTFIAPAVGMLTHGAAFCAAMLHARALGWVFLATFTVHTWRMLLRLHTYVENRARTEWAA